MTISRDDCRPSTSREAVGAPWTARGYESSRVGWRRLASCSVLLICSLAGQPGSSLSAQELSYSWLEVEVGARDSERLLRFRDDTTTATLDAGVAAGLGVAGSWELGDRFYLTGRARQFRSSDVEATLTAEGLTATGFDDVRVDQARLGFGVHWGSNPRFDLFAEIGVERAELTFDRQLSLELPNGDGVSLPRRAFDDTAADLRAGFRRLLSRRFEILAALRLTSLQVGQLEVSSEGDLEPMDDLLAELALVFYPSPRVGLQVRYEGGRADEAVASLRWVF